jgi:GrpB-like predicted nucleotidyltransferase (UPF0157 family)
MPATTPGPILILDYDPAWPALFEAERARLQAAIGEWAVAIEHVGSTSVPGLAAKPIIDIGVALRSFEDALHCITPLFELGYQCLGEYGIPGRVFFRKLTGTPAPGQDSGGIGRTHHVHVYQHDHYEFVQQILFRDYLRAHPETAREYEQLKRQLAREHTDMNEYAMAKTEFVQKILREAGVSVAPANIPGVEETAAQATSPSLRSAKRGSSDKRRTQSRGG